MDNLNFEHPPEKTEEEKRISMIKGVARKNVIDAANRYMTSRDKEELYKIQELVNTLDDAFVLVIPQKDGVPYSITFNPNGEIPKDI